MRTPEMGHEAICLAHAMICAIENARDAIADDAKRMGMSDVADFRSFAQSNTALEWADGYLKDGTATCICVDQNVKRVSFKRISPLPHGSCMTCGEKRVSFLDSDGSLFCSKQHVFDWHGDDIDFLPTPFQIGG